MNPCDEGNLTGPERTDSRESDIQSGRLKFHRAVKWSYATTFGARGSGALFTFLLAAILGPKDFGIGVIAIIYVGFIQAFLDQGFGTALIQRKDLRAEHLDSVFWANLGVGFFLVALSLAFSNLWARANHAPSVAAVIGVLSLLIPIGSLTVVQSAVLQRELNFKSLSVAGNISVMVGGAVGLGMALTGFGVWSLVAQQLIRGATNLVLVWRFSTWRPAFRFCWNALKELLGFAISHFVSYLAILIDQQGAGILLGICFGPIAVGLFKFADRLSNMVLVTATTSVQSVSLPQFSRVQEDPSELKHSVLACLRMSSLLTVPALAGLAFVSTPLVAIAGAKWGPAVPVLKVLCVVGMISMFSYFTGPLLQGLGKPHYMAVLEWSRTTVNVAALVVAAILLKGAGTDRQIFGLAIVRLVTMGLIVVPVYVFLLLRFSRISWKELFATTAPSLLAAGAIGGAVGAFSSSGILGDAHPWIEVIAYAAVGTVAGGTVLLWLDAALRRMVFGLVAKVGAYGKAMKSLREQNL
ncbi:MAG: lipopolysaccharide biosynthesis protein [Candidatus Dormibacteria bacterium]